MSGVHKFGVEGSATYGEAMSSQGIRSLPVLSLDPVAHVGKAEADGLFAGQWGVHEYDEKTGLSKVYDEYGTETTSKRERGLPVSSHNCSSADGNVVQNSGFCRGDAKFSTYHHDTEGAQYGGWRNTRGEGARLYLPSAAECHDCVGTWSASRGVHHAPTFVARKAVLPFHASTTRNTTQSASTLSSTSKHASNNTANDTSTTTTTSSSTSTITNTSTTTNTSTWNNQSSEVVPHGWPDLASVLNGSDSASGWRVGTYTYMHGPGTHTVGADAEERMLEALSLSDAPGNGFVGTYDSSEWACGDGFCHRPLKYQLEMGENPKEDTAYEYAHGAFMKLENEVNAVGRARVSLGVQASWQCSAGWCERDYRSHELVAIDGVTGEHTWSPAFGLNNVNDTSDWQGSVVREWRMDTGDDEKRFYGLYEDGGVKCDSDVASKTGLCRARMRIRTQTGAGADSNSFDSEWRGDGFFLSYSGGLSAADTKPCYECLGDWVYPSPVPAGNI